MIPKVSELWRPKQGNREFEANLKDIEKLYLIKQEKKKGHN